MKSRTSLETDFRSPQGGLGRVKFGSPFPWPFASILNQNQVSLGALSWKLVFWGSKEEYANCTIRERFLTIFWAFIWCFQRYHWTFLKKVMYGLSPNINTSNHLVQFECVTSEVRLSPTSRWYENAENYIVYYLCLCFISFRDVFWKLRQSLEHLDQCSESWRHFRLWTTTSFISMTIQVHTVLQKLFWEEELKSHQRAIEFV